MPLFQGCWQLDNFYKPADCAQRGLTDCYFYYYSICKNGNSCQYRHEPLALGHEVMCNRWLEGRCNEAHCRERHMLIGKRRDRTACFWENTPFGCTKPHCVFRHSLPKNGKSNEILDKQQILAEKNEDPKKLQHFKEELQISSIPIIKVTSYDGSSDKCEEENGSNDTPDVSQSSSGFHSLVDENNLCESLTSDIVAVIYNAEESNAT